MAKVAKIKATLKDAQNARTIWSTIPDFTLGGTSLNDFMALHDAMAASDKEYVKKDVELIGAKKSRDDKAYELNELITRFRSAIRGVYGPDSPIYGQTGATRKSERKSRKRQAAGATAQRMR